MKKRVLVGLLRGLARGKTRTTFPKSQKGGIRYFGRGRVACFGEAAMFTAQLSSGNPMGMNHPDASRNTQLLLNVVHWLTGLLQPAPDTPAALEDVVLSPAGFGGDEKNLTQHFQGYMPP